MTTSKDFSWPLVYGFSLTIVLLGALLGSGETAPEKLLLSLVPLGVALIWSFMKTVRQLVAWAAAVFALSLFVVSIDLVAQASGAISLTFISTTSAFWFGAMTVMFAFPRAASVPLSLMNGTLLATGVLFASTSLVTFTPVVLFVYCSLLFVFALLIFFIPTAWRKRFITLTPASSLPMPKGYTVEEAQNNSKKKAPTSSYTTTYTSGELSLNVSNVWLTREVTFDKKGQLTLRGLGPSISRLFLLGMYLVKSRPISEAYPVFILYGCPPNATTHLQLIEVPGVGRTVPLIVVPSEEKDKALKKARAILESYREAERPSIFKSLLPRRG